MLSESRKVLVLSSFLLLCGCSTLQDENVPYGSRYESKEWKQQFDWLQEQDDTDFLLYVRRLDLAESRALAAIKKAKQFGKDDPRLARSLTSLGRIYLEKAEFEKSLEPLNEAYKIKLAKFGKKSADVADILNEIAFAQINIGHTKAARESLSGAVAIRKEIRDFYASIDSDLVEGLILEKEGDSKAATEKFESTIKQYQSRSNSTTGDLSNEQLSRMRICFSKYLELRHDKSDEKELKELDEKLAYLNDWFRILGQGS